MSSSPRRSPLALAVLGVLAYRPLHPYGIQALLKRWGKDEVVNVGQRAGLYKTINRLHEAGLVAARQTERDQQYPERTIYELTDQGRAVLRQWMGEMLSTPRNEFPELPAALSFLPLLTPEETLRFLEERKALLSGRLARLRATLDAATELGSDPLPRVSMLETEYLHATAAAELRWVTEVVDGLRSGTLTWTDEELRAVASARRDVPDADA
ncbi:PadR family transcriptional regulator [Actinoallomurus sp. NPDC052308]|uniref:PadR family transcriptional regulator n=1 Tax=Actinoallomurus sp. NPDC052308 TaxID=3155530 RepID=UPI0034245CE4